MRKTFFVFPLAGLLSLAACAAPTAPASEDAEPTSEDLTKAKNDLTAKQAKLVVQELNDICGDTWCEGDYSWDFSKIVCDFTKKTCTFTVKITDPGTDASAKDDKVYWRSCKVSKVDAFTSMIDTAPNGYQSLNETFYDKIDACVGKLEAGVSK